MIQLFVSGAKVDLFKDENIEIQDSIQDAKDIGKIFTTFSRTFTVMANKNNNNVFQNFYNFDVVNGFDPREKVRSVITKNGAIYRNGFIQIRNVKLNNNKPTSYTIFFTGLLSTLKDKLQDDRLSDLLELDDYNHEYSEANVQQGFEKYLSITEGSVVQQNQISDVCYPFISVKDRYALNNSGQIKRVNTDTNIITSDNVEYQDLKPAVNVVRIIEAIQSQYDIEFSSNFLKSDANFTNLFLWLNRNKGRLGTEAKYNFKLFNSDLDFVANSGTDFPDVILVYRKGRFDKQEYTYNFTITSTGEGEATISFIDAFTNDVLSSTTFEFDADSNVFTLNYNIQIPESETNSRNYRPFLQFVSKTNGISNLDVEVSIEKRIITSSGDTITSGDYEKLSLKSISSVSITDQVPKLKVIDFLTSIFKMFNLTAEVVDNVVQVLPLDNYYDQGILRNISQYVDITNSTISKVDTIKQFNFKHEEATSLLLTESNKVTDREYGNLEKQLNRQPDKVLGGKSLDIKTSFYKILFERLRAENETLSNIMFGWYVDEDNEALSNEPILFYTERLDTNNAIEFTNNYVPLQHIAPLNATAEYSTNFSDEVNEYSLNLSTGLFRNYYKNYVRRVFSPQSRKIELDAVLRDDFILNYKLNNKLIVNNRQTLINSLNINLNTNKAKIQLLNIPLKTIELFESNTGETGSGQSSGTDELSVSPTSYNFDDSQNSKTFSVESNVSWNVQGLASWLSVDNSSGNNDGSFTITADKNTSLGSRGAAFEVVGGGITVTINVSQDETSDPVLTINPTSDTIDGGGGTANFAVQSNISWSVGALPFWLSVSGGTGTNNGGFSLTAIATPRDRSVNVDISGGALTVTITIIQNI